MAEEKCIYCGGTKFELDMITPCSACPPEEFLPEEFHTSTLSVPDQYRGVGFDRSLVSKATGGDYYVNYMESLLRDIVTTKLRNKNILIATPPQHSKKVFAYSAIQQLFRRKIPVFPLFDILEIKKIMSDLDKSRDCKYLEGTGADPHSLFSCPYLFCIIPTETNFEVYDTIFALKDRRVRRGNTTIFLYSGSWTALIENDRKGIIKNSLGDGSFGSIENKTFWGKSD